MEFPSLTPRATHSQLNSDKKKKYICNVQYSIALKNSSACVAKQALFTLNSLNQN